MSDRKSDFKCLVDFSTESDRRSSLTIDKMAIPSRLIPITVETVKPKLFVRALGTIIVPYSLHNRH